MDAPLDVTEKKKRGRPRSGKVLFQKRVPPEVAAKLKAFLESGCQAGGDDRRVPALLDDIDRLDKRVKDLEERLQKVARMTDDEKCAIWIRKYDDLAASLQKNEFDQT